MKKMILSLGTYLLSLTAYSQCLPSVVNSGQTGDYIASFSLNSLNQTGSGDAACDYEVTDTTTTNLMSGLTYTFLTSFGPTATNQYFALWIDLNGNGVFDVSEMLYSSSTPTTSPSTLMGTIVIPTATISSRVAMRICTKRDTMVNATESCNLNSYGEFHDYVVNLNTIMPCSGAPNPGNTLVLCCPGTLNKLFKISNTMNAVNSYQWESSPNNISWTPILNTNHDYYSPTLSSTTNNLCYRCLVTCTFSGLSSYSTPICSPCNPLSVHQNEIMSNWVVQPNPFGETLNVSITASHNELMKLCLFNSMGTKVRELDMNLKVGVNRIELETNQLSQGIYFLQVSERNGLTRNVKLVKSL